MVRLEMSCAGALISDRHVLTAYHCLQQGVRFNLANGGAGETVKVGVHNQWDPADYQEVPILRAVYPPGAGDINDIEDTGIHDIAIIILARPVILNLTIQPICLPASDEFVWQGSTTTTAGWGTTHNSTLQQAEPRQVLLRVNPTDYSNGNFFYTDVDVVKGVAQDPCAGDSGGPLMHWSQGRWTVIGTVFGEGYDCRTAETNGKGKWNTVTAHLDWIKDVLSENDLTSKCALQSG